MHQSLQSYGERLSSSARELFSERARWVHTWIASRALPFAALIALALTCHSIGSGASPLRKGECRALGMVVLGVVVARATAALVRRRWVRAAGSYQASLAFAAAVLVLGVPTDTATPQHWSTLVGAFWVIGLAYPRGWFVPGEFAVVALILAGRIAHLHTPLPDWLFTLVVFVPVAVWLAVRARWKPVILLVALVVLLWMRANVGGYAVPVTLAGSALIWGAVYALGKLRGNDVSSFIRSIGLGVVSCLLVIVFFALFRGDPEEISTWLPIFATFVVIAGIIRRKHGSGWTTLLVLWLVHWYLVLHWVAWHDLVGGASGEWWALSTGLVACAVMLRYSAFWLDSNRMLVWSRIYVMLAAVNLLGVRSEMTLGRLSYVLLLFLLVLLSARGRTLAHGAAWWRGILDSRHVVAMRRMARSSGKLVSSIPIVGATLSALIQGLRVLMNMKRGKHAFHSGDALVIAAIPFLAIVLAHWLEQNLVSTEWVLYLTAGSELTPTVDETASPAIEHAREVIRGDMVYVLCGLLLMLANLVYREPVFAMLGMVSFCIGPVTMMIENDTGSALFWMMLALGAIGILGLRELGGQGAAAPVGSPRGDASLVFEPVGTGSDRRSRARSP